ncbi:M48 family metallopeptidase [Bdellovibrio sp. HCB337]|uniref:M48 family metallopeptidase n=1 Tax=Bdellovibrio sp. HCB337 TaxID=3394358 RepID=UPI0039A6C577
MLDFIEYGNSKIEFKIKRSGRKTLGISVLPCGSIEVSAPEEASLDKIREVVLKRGSWILEQQRLSEYNPILQPTKSLVSGESFYLLGRHYRLKIFESNYDSVDILNDRIILNCTFPEDIDLKRSTLIKWYMKKANDVLGERFRFYAERFDKNEIELVVKKLTKNWGEYHPLKKQMALNAELVTAPLECIDYVIVHEFCHVDELSHGAKFYDLLTRRLPQWHDLKNELERHSNGFNSFF